MTKVIDPDSLVRSSTKNDVGKDGNIWIDTDTRKIQMAAYGDLSTYGVTIQAFYSYLKAEWKTDAALIKFPFPMVAITPEQFEFVDDWQPEDQVTSDLFRDGGYAIKNADGTSAEEYFGAITLGSLGESDQVYYQQDGSGATPNAYDDVVLTGVVNQCIKIFGDGGNLGISNVNALDYRSSFKIFVREYQKQYAQSELGDIGVTTLTYQAYRFPLANSDDLKITHNDGDVSTITPYTDMTITYHASAVQRSIGGTNYNFDVIIDAGTTGDANAEEIYEFVQWSLRQTTDVDDGTGDVKGNTANGLLKFVGDTLVTSQGVYIDDFSSVDINRIEFYDNTNTKRTFPFMAAGTINFNTNLVDDSGAVYRMFFTDANGNSFGDSDALIVEDNDANPISGNIDGPQVSFTFDYDGNIQGGRTAAQDAAVTVVAIGLDKAQYVKTTSTIGRSNANSVSLVASLERNYYNA